MTADLFLIRVSMRRIGTDFCLVTWCFGGHVGSLTVLGCPVFTPVAPGALELLWGHS